jgi:dihydroorotate dehydrogenase
MRVIDDLLRAAGTRGYRWCRPLLFATSAQRAHEVLVRLLAVADRSAHLCKLARDVHRAAFHARPVSAGGVDLPHPFILAAGLVKGAGFATESDAIDAVRRGQNIIPGWRSMPALVGPLEIGSFTRYPRLGNPGTVVWRDAATRSTQNRVGLRNPGARAAAAFLAARRHQLPACFGISIASSPGVTDPAHDQRELVESVLAFIDAGIRPSWFSLNLSCPNTEDDPAFRQTETAMRSACSAIISALQRARAAIPVWVKVGPGLPDRHYRIMLRVFSEVGARAIIATNTLGRPAPSPAGSIGGVGGGDLHAHAVRALAVLAREKRERGYPIDLIGSGGIQDLPSYRAFAAHGVHVVQYWSAIVFRGPLAAALILDELVRADARITDSALRPRAAS